MLNIRAGKHTDLETIVSFQLTMAQETEGLALDLPTVHEGVAAVFNDPHKGTYYIAEADNAIIASLLIIPEWSDWRNGTVLWIHSLYVVPEARGQGVFRALYSHLKRMVAERPDLRGLRLYVDRTNVKARQAYVRMGMNPDHYEMFEWMKPD